MIVYFSGTGNSRFCAEYLARKRGEEAPLDAFSYIRNGIAADLISGTPWVFVCPTYGWRLPRIVQDFLRSGSFQGSRDAYFVMTCGSEIGHAPLYNRRLCRELGLRYRGTLEVVMPENYIALFDAPERAEALPIIDAALPVLDRGADCLQADADFPEPLPGIVDRIKSTLVNPLFYRLVIRARPFTVSDGCIGCGKCEEACVLGNIRLEGGRPVWGDACTHCMACICGCPTEAIEYGRASAGKVRYRFPADAYARYLRTP